MSAADSGLVGFFFPTLSAGSFSPVATPFRKAVHEKRPILSIPLELLLGAGGEF
jgi:hypothetical protein